MMSDDDQKNDELEAGEDLDDLSFDELDADMEGLDDPAMDIDSPLDEMADLSDDSLDAGVDDGFGDDFDSDWGDDDAGFDDGSAQASGGKKEISKFNLAIMGGAVLIGGFFMVSQFMGGGVAPQPVDTAQQVQPEEIENSDVFKPKTSQRDIMYGRDNPEVEDGLADPTLGAGLIDDPSLVYEERNPIFDEPEDLDDVPPMPDLGADDPLTPMPLPTNDTQYGMQDFDSAPDMTDTSGDAMFDDDGSDGAFRFTDVDSDDGMMAMGDGGMEMPMSDQADDSMFAQDTAVSAENPAMSTIGANDLADQVDMLISRLDTIETRMDTMKSGANSNEIDDLRATVASLEAEIKKLKSGSGSMMKKSSNRSSSAKTSSSSKKAVVKRSSYKSNAKASDWELRGAAPGMAYVSMRGKDDVMQVSVGETLDGVGRIKRIDFVNNLWVVEGTKGRITQ